MATEAIAQPVVFARAESHGRLAALGIVLRNWMTALGVALVVLLILSAVLANLLHVRDPSDMSGIPLLAPGQDGYLLGTDKYGRDMLSRLIHGARTSLLVSLSAVAGGCLIGTALGVAGGYFGGIVDDVIGRVSDVLLCFPMLVLLLVIVATLGPGLVNGILAMTVALIPGFGRIARAVVLTEKNKDYVIAARCAGARDRTIMARHILPNSLTPTVVQATLAIPGLILTEASLSFLGLGVTPPTPSWGQMISEGQPLIEFAPWASILPGLAILLAVLGFNLAGDGLRDYLDPRMRRGE
jgi:peptide/nickel transport system permease protein